MTNAFASKTNLIGRLVLVSTFIALSSLVVSAYNGNGKKKRNCTCEQKTSPDPARDTEYKIGPQDVLRIDVWKEDQLTRTVPVRPDGKVTLPLLNDVQAAGMTPAELAGVMSEELKKYLTAPQVSVTVSEINSRRVYVTGEVARSGAYPLLPKMTVLQALSSSGGFTQFARSKNIYVLRVTEGQQVKLPFNYSDVVNGKKPEQNFLLAPGDVIVVP
jgi:polysaccharide export outer membrane protein